jgi:uncharacterized protein YcaQ
VLISKRIGNRRYYDLPERVLPPGIINCQQPAASETRRWTTFLKLRQRRLARLSPAELSLVSDLVQPITVDKSLRVYCLREDLSLLNDLETPGRVALLAPLDPLIYDRRVTHELWDFNYTWEVYTPPSRRMRGYYALPILSDLEIVGHVDPKADRVSKTLKIMNRSVRRGHDTARALQELAEFLALSRAGSS